MTASDTTPVIVGIGQVDQRPEDPRQSREPLGLMLDSIRAAGEDSSAPALLARANSVRVINGGWRYRNPAKPLAQAIGAVQAETAGTPFGGAHAQAAFLDACESIQRGELDVAIVVGAECGYSRRAAAKAGVELNWSEAPGDPDRMIGEDAPMLHEAEEARSIVRPFEVYSLFETAFRHRRGAALEEHSQRIAELYARFSGIASKNPRAWLRQPKSPEEIGKPGPDNRMISTPYTMLMISNSRVDQGAALLVCSVATAKANGVPREKWIFPWAGANGVDAVLASNRADFHSSPSIRYASRALFEHSRIGVDQLDYVDLYSCFPSAVQIAANEIGLSLDRPLTVTGGMVFGGGPLNCYALRSMTRMGELLRSSPGTRGLVTANGGYLSKHSLALYSTEEPASPFQMLAIQDRVDVIPRREVAMSADGPCEIEGYTVNYGAAEPERAAASVLLPDGRRAWAISLDPDLMQAMVSEEFCGRLARIAADGTLRV